MNASQQVLFERLLAFQIDEPATELTFARRLAREQGWNQAYAERVIVEYKRFLFLAVAAGHVVTPSEQVDQAWHLHLTYTRSYWEDLCRDVLQMPLHHGPTKGGAAEQGRFVDLYIQTLASYRRFFGHEPPRDIWPPAEQRFGEDLQHVSVNTARYWIVPKPRWPRALSRGVPLFAIGLVGLPLAVSNPLDWKGPEFLTGYLVLVIVAAMLAFIIRMLFAPQATSLESKDKPPCDPYEIACLAGGPARAAEAAFASMVQAGNLRLVRDDKKFLGIVLRNSSTIEQGKALRDDAPRLEHAIYEAAASPAESLAPLTKAGLPVAQNMNDDLIERGLVNGSRPPLRCVIAGLIMAAPLLLGVTKIAVGISLERPVILLIVACLATAAAALGFLLARKRLTAAGEALLKSLQAKHAGTTDVVKSAADTATPADLALTVGLFGAGMLAAGPLADVYAMLPRNSGGGGCSASAGCGGGGCGGGGCGGGCGGCGGCGG